MLYAARFLLARRGGLLAPRLDSAGVRAGGQYAGRSFFTLHHARAILREAKSTGRQATDKSLGWSFLVDGPSHIQHATN